MLNFIKESDMNILEDHIGEQVFVYFIVFGNQYLVVGILDCVVRYKFIKLRDFKFLDEDPLEIIPEMSELVDEGNKLQLLFIWLGLAIKKIENESVLYHNLLIPENYNALLPVTVRDFIEISFGNKVASEYLELQAVLRIYENYERQKKAKWN